jgi:hypothetical protein
VVTGASARRWKSLAVWSRAAMMRCYFCLEEEDNESGQGRGVFSLRKGSFRVDVFTLGKQEQIDTPMIRGVLK